MSKESEAIQVLIEKYKFKIENNNKDLFNPNTGKDIKEKLIILNAKYEEFINELETILR